ncbi:hypothetical protein KFK09_026454 [Dendrobium nobile]|uniref:Uncharacterized protein n=1 Tax=Dendrobium nobile TaxID=94219 RepID=A0A8T3A7U7_DENNO|nr:hypothetical protein KFK09_026454 [Dendrobium nobile]
MISKVDKSNQVEFRPKVQKSPFKGILVILVSSQFWVKLNLKRCRSLLNKSISRY